jgi:iron complex transport system substrate-binding protein
MIDLAARICERNAGLGSLAALLLVATLGVAGCRGPEHRSARGAELRVISLHDVTTEIVVALGGGAQLVGMVDLVDASDELRAATAAVPRVGELETLLAVDPDVVIGLEIVRSMRPDIAAGLEQRGKSVHLPALTSVGDVASLIREVARRLNKVKEGERLLGDLMIQVGARVATPEPIRVFVYDCCDPPFTAGKRTVLSDLIAQVGGINVFGDLDVAYTHVSWEEVLKRKPDVVVVHAYGAERSADARDKIAALGAMDALRGLPTAVMPLRYSLGGLKIGEAAKVLRSALARRTVTGAKPTSGDPAARQATGKGPL